VQRLHAIAGAEDQDRAMSTCGRTQPRGTVRRTEAQSFSAGHSILTNLLTGIGPGLIGLA
jgi:hypothetical protein